MNDCLNIKNLCKSYNGFSLQDVSFSLPGGAILGLIGENGAGKTTTIKLILNLIGRSGGEITIFGKDNIRDEREIKKSIGVVFDDCRFSLVLAARDVNAIMKNMHKNWSEELFSGYLRSFSLDPKKKIKDYSKGMKTKLSIAAALSHSPKLLILDEATSGLDPIARAELMDVFRAFIKDEEHSILLSTHITSDLERVADYIVFMSGGRAVLQAERDTLLEEYAIARCGDEAASSVPKSLIAGSRRGEFGNELLINRRRSLPPECRNMVLDRPTLEDIMTYLVKGEQR